MRRTTVVISVLAVAGCVEISGLVRGSPEGEVQTLNQISLYNNEVVVAAPRGYCVDATQIKQGSFGAFIPIGSCESLTGKAGVPVEPGLITVSVLPRQSDRANPSAAEITASMPGDQPLQSIEEDGLSIVHFATGGARALPGGDPRFWRGGMMINGHLLGIAVYGPKGSPLADKQGLRLLRNLARELRRRSPQTAEDAAPGTRDAQARSPGLGRKGLLDGLFPKLG